MILNTDFPYISIIVPIYGVDKYLDECIQSIVDQSYLNLEIILVDDGSKGREPEICDVHAKKDTRIKVIHKANGGSVAARLTGLENATSPYVTFVDGDDYISADYIEKMMEHIIQGDPDMVAVSYTRFDGNYKKEEHQNISDGIYQNSELVWLFRNMNCINSEYYRNGIFSTACHKVFKTDLLLDIAKKVPTMIKMGDDAALAFPYILNCRKIIVDNTICGYYYRTVANSQSRNVDSNILIASSALYEHLKPFYYDTKDKDIIAQLDLYRLFLIVVPFYPGLDNSGPNMNHLYCKIIKNSVSNLEIFNNLENLLFLNIPRFEKTVIKQIIKHNWVLLELCCDYRYFKSKYIN